MKNIDTQRIHEWQSADYRQSGNYILYWMSGSFRAQWNYALEYAVGLAEKFDGSVLALISLPAQQDHYADRQLRFLLQALPSLRADLSQRKVKLILRIAKAEESVADLAQDAIAIVTDFPYLDYQREALEQVKAAVSLPVVALEGNIVVPVQTASDKQEYAARTLRPKLMDQYADFLTKPRSSSPPKSSMPLQVASEDLAQGENLLTRFTFAQQTPEVSSFCQGGEEEAHRHLDDFLHHKLSRYDDQRQSPTEAAVSGLSKYLAWGMLAPAYILQRLERYTPSESLASFREELLVRRELAINFVYYAESYESINSLPDWAQDTLETHKDDEREHHYTRAEFEAGQTHDEAWNECMRRIKEDGYLHNHLRMYWGKQVLAWSNTPHYAHQTLLYLNNKYFLDGQTPNSYANTLWVFGLHDRAWQENEVFGKVRLMNHNGLKRKVDLESLIASD